MTLAAVNSVTAQATMRLNTVVQDVESEKNETNPLAVTDVVDISEEGYTLASQASSESADAASEQAQNAGAAAGSTATSSTTSSEATIDDLQEQIRELEKEIAELTAKARTDETARQEMNAKQTELAALYNELVQLQQSQEQS